MDHRYGNQPHTRINSYFWSTHKPKIAKQSSQQCLAGSLLSAQSAFSPVSQSPCPRCRVHAADVIRPRWTLRPLRRCTSSTGSGWLDPGVSAELLCRHHRLPSEFHLCWRLGWPYRRSWPGSCWRDENWNFIKLKPYQISHYYMYSEEYGEIEKYEQESLWIVLITASNTHHH